MVCCAHAQVRNFKRKKVKNMTMNSHHGSARIYEFTPRARTLGKDHRDEAKRVADITSPQQPQIVFGSGWYHDAAVQESERIKGH